MQRHAPTATPNCIAHWEPVSSGASLVPSVPFFHKSLRCTVSVTSAAGPATAEVTEGGVGLARPGGRNSQLQRRIGSIQTRVTVCRDSRSLCWTALNEAAPTSHSR
eukprot:scaffold231091_cov30-Tisochrysis_lutea.AAC.2